MQWVKELLTLILGRRTFWAIAVFGSLLSCTHGKRDQTVTLGFAHVKDVSPVTDQDAYQEELKLKKELPENSAIYAKRAMHEAALLNDFVAAFKDSKECNGITLYMHDDKKPAFNVLISVDGHDESPDNQTWVWILGWPGDPSPADKEGHGVGGIGSQSTATLIARDICLTIWDDLDPNHFKKPGGRVE